MSTSTVRLDEHGPPVLIDEPPTVDRSRRPLDAARLAITLTGVVLVVVLSVTAERTVAGIEGDLNEASALVPGWVLLPLTLVAAFSTLAVWIGFVGLEISQRRGRTAAEMVLAGITTAILLGGLSLFLQSDLGPEGLSTAFRPPTSGLIFPTSSAATVALVSVVGWAERRWVQRLSLVAVVGGTLDLLLGGQVTPQGAALGLLVGRAVALTVRLVSGVPTERPDGASIAAGLHNHGIDVRQLLSRSDAWPRVYTIHTGDDALDLVVLDRDREGTGLLSNAWQWLRLRGDILPRESVTMRGGTDQRALAALAMAQAGVRSPSLQACFALGMDAIALVYEQAAGTRLSDVIATEQARAEQAHTSSARTDTPVSGDAGGPVSDSPLPDGAAVSQEGIGGHDYVDPAPPLEAALLPEASLDDLWEQVRRMRAAGIAHRQLAAETVALDDEGSACILEHFSATVAANWLGDRR